MLRTLLAAAALFWATAAAPQDQTDSTTLSLVEARHVARQALYAGRFDLARDIAMGLVQADPEDPYAYAILAAAHARLNDPRLARAAARLSYRYSDSGAQKFDAARNAARVAFQQQRPTLSQAWLRLAAIHAETPTQEKLLARDYRQVRSANPLHFNLNLSVAPSDNVNNGTDNVLEVNNGVPTLGRFGGSSRALSGTVGILDLRLRYRLARSAAGVTTATGRLYTRQVDLSDSAQAQAPDVSNGDFGSTYVELGLERRLAFGKRGNTASVSGAFGASWSGGNRSYDFAKLGLSRGLRLSPSTRLSLRGGVERRLSTRSAAWDADVLTLGSSLSHKRENGDRFSLGLTVQNVTGERLNADYDTASLRAAYTFAKPLGPAQVTAGVTLGVTDYDKYTLVGPVPGGREDQSFYGDVSFFFKDYDYAGFAPTVRLRTGKRTSNVNRFDISESTISLGLQSKF